MTTESITLDLRPGSLYDYSPTTARQTADGTVIGQFALGRYRVLGVATDTLTLDRGHTRRELVIYEKADPPGAGLWFACTLSDFAVRFVPVEPGISRVGHPVRVDDPPLPPVPAEWRWWEKPAGYITREGVEAGWAPPGEEPR